MAIGDVVGTLSAPSVPSASFTLSSNPGGYFGISGSTLIEAINTPPGVYSIGITATMPGVTTSQSLVLTFSGVPLAGIAGIINTLTGNVLINPATGNPFLRAATATQLIVLSGIINTLTGNVLINPTTGNPFSRSP
jgi:hypothetical protein